MGLTRKPRLVMLAAHEPSQDPRVDWEAASAARDFDVVVIGLHGKRPPLVDPASYALVRLEEPSRVDPQFLSQLAAVIVRSSMRRLRRSLSWRPLTWPFWWLTAASEITLRIVVGVLDLIVRSLPWTTVGAARDLRLEEPGQQPRAGIIRQMASLYRCLLLAQAFSRHVRSRELELAIIHCNDFDTLLAGVLCRSDPRTRLVYDAHEGPQGCADAPWYARRFFGWLERVLVRRVDHVVTVSEPLARLMERLLGIGHVELVPNAEPWRDRAPPPTTSMTTLAEARVRFLFMGGFAPGRGLEELLAAWASIPSDRAALFLQGPGNREREALEAMASSLNLLNRTVYFLDPVDEAELVDRASEADVGIIPYKRDWVVYRYCCPNKLSQYMHAGLALLTNDLDYVRSIVAKADCGVCYDLSSKGSLQNALERLIDESGQLQRWKRNSLDFGRREFNWGVQGAPLLELYRRGPREASTPSGGRGARDSR